MHFPTILANLFLAATLATAAELQIDVTNPVECNRKTTNGDTVKMHYRGTLADSGKQFDASYDRGTPLSFKLGTGRVIKGWDQGLLDMCVGEKRTLTIPPELGYGNRAMGPIPAGSTLVFETELVEIDGVPKDEL
ncbi:hypothetical protein DPV78_004229 [Talaromyces pinophilus]|nr:hypothetical protein DPV78_004229 [Talaromyces pinophilus]